MSDSFTDIDVKFVVVVDENESQHIHFATSLLKILLLTIFMNHWIDLKETCRN